MTLPANSTFLPILDDLLSPDLRPVLQTPTTEYCSTPGSGVNKLFVIGSNGCSAASATQAYSKGLTANANGRERGTIPEECEQEASVKIQNWWRSRNSGFAPRRNSAGQVLDVRAERAKHSIRHNRTEDHIHYLETEVGRLKSALSSERKLRSLQLEAIRSLWGQVQKISSSNDPNQSIMTQSMPNGLPISPPKKETHKPSAMSMSFSGGTLTTLDEEKVTKATSKTGECGGACSKEIQLLRESLTSEISQLREMITRLTVDGSGKANQVQIVGVIGTSEPDSDVSALSSVGETEEKNKEKEHHPQRPLSLNIIGMAQGQGQADQKEEPEKKEIRGYANEMANKLLEDAAVEKDEESTVPSNKPISGESHF